MNLKFLSLSSLRERKCDAPLTSRATMGLMKLRVEPLLQLQRNLYDLPAPEPRFSEYVRHMTGGTQDAVLPLGVLNPMGKAHVPAFLDRLIELEAESIAAEACREAEQRLQHLPGELRIGLVLADDSGGGWTNRYLTEAEHYFERKYDNLPGWAVTLLWTSEDPSGGKVRREVLAEVYRALHIRQHGLPGTLRQMMIQEGRVAVFAGAREPTITGAELDQMRERVRPYLDSARFPTIFACLYGDEAAESVGIPPLGLPERAGFAIALQEASRTTGRDF